MGDMKNKQQKERIPIRRFNLQPPTKANQANPKKTNHGHNNSTVAVRYRHIRQACTHVYFRNIEKKGIQGKYFSFITPQTEQFLAVEVVTPILRDQNRMIRRLPLEINILYKNAPVLRWQKKIYWEDNGRKFMSEIHSYVGRALRLIYTEQVLKDGEAPILVGTSYKNQSFQYSDNTAKNIRRALLDL